MTVTMWTAFVCLSSFLLIFINGEVFIMHRHEANSTKIELTCYFNGPQSESTGLGWVLPSANKTIIQHSERWRHTTRAGLLKGHFEYYGHIWISTSSLQFKPPNFLPPVLDERWNDFKEVRTSGGVDFTRAIMFTTDRIYISILAKSDAHIALSTGTNPYSSHTYWISLDQFAISGSAIRRCSHGLPRSLLPRFSECKQIRAGHKGTDMLRDGNKWIHLKIQISKSNGSLTIKVNPVSTDPADKDVDILNSMTWTDPNPFLGVKYISYRTQDTAGLWRLHEYQMVVHNGRSDGEGFNVFQIAEPHHCCLQLNYFFRSGYGSAAVNSKDKNQTIVLSPNDASWQVLKVNMNLKPPSDHIHFVPPLGDFERTGYVFAISQPFRICGDEEFFVTKVSAEPEQLKNAKCMDLKNSKFASFKEETSLTRTISDCPNNKFSKSCNISCGRVVGDFTCRGKVICDSDLCSCLSGFKPTSLWNTTCLEHIESDIASITTIAPSVSRTTEEEMEVEGTELSIDVDLGEEGIDYDSYDDKIHDEAESAKHAADAVCSGKNNNVAVIVLSIITTVLLVCAVLAVWYWRTNVWPHAMAFDVRWRQNQHNENQLIHNDIEDN